MSAMQQAMEAERAYRARIAEKVLSDEMGGAENSKMTLEVYEAARLALEKRLAEAGERERAHKEKASLDYQKTCKSLQAKIGDLKRQQRDALQKYKQDKIYIPSLYRDEKLAINTQMHTLKMKYLADNGLDLKKKKPLSEQEQE